MKRNLILSVVVFTLCFVVAESGIRLYFLILYGDNFFVTPLLRSHNFLVSDERLGWRARPNYSWDRRSNLLNGEPSITSGKFDASGFRLHGQEQGARPVILFIGDSFTQAVTTTEESTFYARIQQKTGYNVFAIGVGGYGNLQEYMLLQEIIPTIHPDIIVWQLCGNDFDNNSLAEEKRSHDNNNFLRRPYLENDEIAYHLPIPRYPEVLGFLVSHSCLVFRLLPKLFHAFPSLVDRPPDPQDPQGEVVTARIFQKAATLTRGIQVLGFSASTASEEEHVKARRILELFEQQGFATVPGIPDAIRAADGGKLNFYTEDEHWAPPANDLAAEMLLPKLREMAARVSR